MLPATADPPPVEDTASRLALLLSVVFSPFICVPLFILVLVDATARSRSEFYFLSVLCIALSIGLPLAYIAVNVRRGKISDIHVSQLDQRQGPFRAGQVGLSLLALALWRCQAPCQLTHYVLSLLVQAALFQVISRRWKISLHTGVLGACLAGCVAIANWSTLCLLWLGPLCWARATRKRHLWSQAAAGGLLGYLVTFYLLRLLGSNS